MSHNHLALNHQYNPTVITIIINPKSREMATKPDLSTLLETNIRDRLPEDVVREILASHPFIPIPNVLNLRTISHPPHLPPNIIFRSGALSHLPASALSPLADTYNIKTIFDLRTAAERQKSPSPDIPGIKTIWIPSGVDVLASTGPSGEVQWKVERFGISPADFVANKGKDGFVKMYSAGLELHREPYKAVFETLRDSEGGMLFHCTGLSGRFPLLFLPRNTPAPFPDDMDHVMTTTTDLNVRSAGKDRTGVLSALILSLFEAPEQVIAQDYALTRIGTEPFRDVLLGKLVQQMGDDGKAVGLNTPGMEEMCSTRGDSILAFLRSVDEKWGGEGKGVKGYLTEVVGLSEEDLMKIKEKLRATNE